jgi:hypothetical protein
LQISASQNGFSQKRQQRSNEQYQRSDGSQLGQQGSRAAAVAAAPVESENASQAEECRTPVHHSSSFLGKELSLQSSMKLKVMQS